MDFFNFLPGINSDHSLAFVSIRTICIYLFSIAAFRFANTRFRFQTPFDYVLPIIVGSVLSRGVNGGASLVSSIVASIIFIFLHWLFAYFAFKSHRFGKWVKGKRQILYAHNQFNRSIMKKNQISENDILDECRFQLRTDKMDNIDEIYIERSGNISIILKSSN